MGNHNSFNINHKEQLHSARINSLAKDPTLGMLPMEKLGKVLRCFYSVPIIYYVPRYFDKVWFDFTSTRLLDSGEIKNTTASNRLVLFGRALFFFLSVFTNVLNEQIISNQK